MIGLVASIFVAWFAIALVERPGAITGPIVVTKRITVTQDDKQIANKDNRFKPTPSRDNANDNIRSPSADVLPATKHGRITQTTGVAPNSRDPSGFTNRNIAGDTRKTPSSRRTTSNEASLVGRGVDASPLALQPEGRPPIPRRNSLRQASRATAIIGLPERRPARTPPPPPPSTIKARATNPFRDDSRMGLGLYNLMIERPPPVQRPAPANDRQTPKRPRPD